jgi:hypothetical protein
MTCTFRFLFVAKQLISVRTNMRQSTFELKIEVATRKMILLFRHRTKSFFSPCCYKGRLVQTWRAAEGHLGRPTYVSQPTSNGATVCFITARVDVLKRLGYSQTTPASRIWQVHDISIHIYIHTNKHTYTHTHTHTHTREIYFLFNDYNSNNAAKEIYS